MTCGSFREAGVTPLTRTADLTPAPDCPFLPCRPWRPSVGGDGARENGASCCGKPNPTSSSVLPSFCLRPPVLPVSAVKSAHSPLCLLGRRDRASDRKAPFSFSCLSAAHRKQGDDGRGVRGRYAMGYRLKEGRYAPRSSKRSNGHHRTTLREEGERENEEFMGMG